MILKPPGQAKTLGAARRNERGAHHLPQHLFGLREAGRHFNVVVGVFGTSSTTNECGKEFFAGVSAPNLTHVLRGALHRRSHRNGVGFTGGRAAARGRCCVEPAEWGFGAFFHPCCRRFGAICVFLILHVPGTPTSGSSFEGAFGA